MNKKLQNNIYFQLTESTIIDGHRLKSDENYLGAVTEKIANVSGRGMNGCDLQDWLVEGDWKGGETVGSVASEWDELNNQEL